MGEEPAMKTQAVRWSLIAASLVAAACAFPTTTDVDRLRVLLEVDSPVLEIGREAEVVLTLRNTGSSAVVITGLQHCPPFGFRVLSSSGELLAPRPTQVCALLPGEWRVEAHGALITTRQWNGTVPDVNGAPVSLPPGEYFLEAFVGGPGDRLVAGPRVALRISDPSTS